MARLIAIVGTLLLSIQSLAWAADAPRTVDLRDAGALEQLQRSNPAHFKKIQQLLAGLREQPSRAEGDWLQTTFDAHNVNLSRFLMRTSNPPKQLLQFTLDDVQYTMHLVRTDLTVEMVPAQ
jgi:hypothetical protein